jgi:hypothetical protein
MNDFLRYQRTVFFVILGLTVAAVAGLALGFPDRPAYAAGWALGGVAGLVVYRLRVVTILRLPNLPENEWRKLSLKVSLFSYALLIGVVVLALALELFHPYTVLGGLVLERVLLIADGWLRPAALSEGDEAADPSAEDEAHSPTAGEETP